MPKPSDKRTTRRPGSFVGRHRTGLLLGLLCAASPDSFATDLNLRTGITDMSQRIYDLHQISLWICTIVGIVVFGAMFYTMFAHRRSKHPKPADFHESTLVEVIWTIVPGTDSYCLGGAGYAGAAGHRGQQRC